MTATTAETVTVPAAPCTSATGTTSQLTAALTWRPHQPLQVDLQLTHHRQTSRWLLARDLLAAGLDAPAGEGDITVFPDLAADGRRVELVLRHSAGIGHNLAITLPVAAIRRWLDRTYQTVPAGAENYAFNPAELLDGAA